MGIRILVIDPHPLLRLGAIRALDAHPDLEAVGETDNVDEGFRLARTLAPDLILLELTAAGISGAETLRALRGADNQARVVIFTASDSDIDLITCLHAGASGYLLKTIEPDTLATKLRAAAGGEIAISDSLTSSLARALTQGRSRQDAGLASLTARQREILRHLARGESNKAIARGLGITEGTTKVHVKNLLRKMGFRSRVEAAVWAVQNGLR